MPVWPLLITACKKRFVLQMNTVYNLLFAERTFGKSPCPCPALPTRTCPDQTGNPSAYSITSNLWHSGIILFHMKIFQLYAWRCPEFGQLHLPNSRPIPNMWSPQIGPVKSAFGQCPTVLRNSNFRDIHAKLAVRFVIYLPIP
jgi:hypothetical protein